MFYFTYFMREVPKNHLKSILSWSHEKVKLVAICNLQGLVGTILTTEITQYVKWSSSLNFFHRPDHVVRARGSCW